MMNIVECLIVRKQLHVNRHTEINKLQADFVGIRTYPETEKTCDIIGVDEEAFWLLRFHK